MKKWEKLERKIAYDSKFVKVYEDKVRLPNNTIIENYTVVKKMDIVIIVATTKNEEVLAITEYKYGADSYLKVLPAGHIEDGENPIETAKRELLEETGYAGEKYEYVDFIYEYPSKDSHKVHIVRVFNITKKEDEKTEITESIDEVFLVPLKKLVSEIKNKEWKVSSALAALVLSDIKII
jgi:ADP-ribose pyrophosphatase